MWGFCFRFCFSPEEEYLNLLKKYQKLSDAIVLGVILACVILDEVNVSCSRNPQGNNVWRINFVCII